MDSDFDYCDDFHRRSSSFISSSASQHPPRTSRLSGVLLDSSGRTTRQRPSFTATRTSGVSTLQARDADFDRSEQYDLFDNSESGPAAHDLFDISESGPAAPISSHHRDRVNSAPTRKQ